MTQPSGNCAGCNRNRILLTSGCCAKCNRFVNAVISRLEESEQMSALETPLHEFHQAEARFQGIISDFSARLIEMKRRRKPYLDMPGGWRLYRKVAQRTVAGAQADLKTLREGLKRYQETIERAA